MRAAGGGAHLARGGGEQRHRRAEDKRRAQQTHQAVFGFTNMRPRISMWSAWQNHWQ